MTVSPRRLANALVTAQFTLLAAQLLLRRRRNWPTPIPVRAVAVAGMIVGAAISTAAATHLGPGLTASPLPNAAAELRDHGLYRSVRHPIYSGLLLASAARTAGSGDRRQVAVTLALTVLLGYKSRFEERALRSRFSGYAEYARRTPRFVPALGRSRRSERDGRLTSCACNSRPVPTRPTC